LVALLGILMKFIALTAQEVQAKDKRMKATYLHKMKVIAIAACLSQGDFKAMRKEYESASECAVQGNLL
jgi:hypothetical protein